MFVKFDIKVYKEYLNKQNFPIANMNCSVFCFELGTGTTIDNQFCSNKLDLAKKNGTLFFSQEIGTTSQHY